MYTLKIATFINVRYKPWPFPNAKTRFLTVLMNVF